MSKKTVFELLKELGGTATTKKLRAKAKEKYPEFTLEHYVVRELKKLEKDGYVSRNSKEQADNWTIIKEYE